MINRATRALVRQRAGDRCEYCLIRQEHTITSHHVEHITPIKHGGSDDPSNLALACIHCNRHKGSNLTGIDPDTGAVTSLYDPRAKQWMDHSWLRGTQIVGRTPTGRTTVHVLAMNAYHRLDVREELIGRGLFP